MYLKVMFGKFEGWNAMEFDRNPPPAYISTGVQHRPLRSRRKGCSGCVVNQANLTTGHRRLDSLIFSCRYSLHFRCRARDWLRHWQLAHATKIKSSSILEFTTLNSSDAHIYRVIAPWLSEVSARLDSSFSLSTIPVIGARKRGSEGCLSYHLALFMQHNPWIVTRSTSR